MTLLPVSTAADGTFTLSDTPTAPGTYTYAASYGDSSAGSVVVDVTPETERLTSFGTFSYTAQYAGSPTAGPATAQWTVTVPHPGAA